MEHPNSDRLSKGFTGNEKFRIENYELNTFDVVLSNMYDLEYVEHHMINWDILYERTNDLITERLFTLQTDIQRTAFLSHYFRTLIEGVRYMTLELAFDYLRSVGDRIPDKDTLSKISNVNSLYEEIFQSEKTFFYIIESFTTLNKVVVDVSETSLLYDGVDFDKIIERSILPFSRQESSLTWLIKGGGMKFGKIEDSGPYQPEDATAPAKIIPLKTPAPLKKLFNDNEDARKYLDLLKNKKPAVIDDHDNFIKGIKSKSKAVIVAWFDALKTKKGVINSDINTDIERAAAINNAINNLEISDRSLTLKPTQIYNTHYTYFLGKIR